MLADWFRLLLLLLWPPLAAAACVSSLELEGRPCPCARGFDCCASTQRCQPAGEPCARLDGRSDGPRRVNPILLEAEDPPTEDFPLMPRAAASGEQTVLLQVGQTRHLAFFSAAAGHVTLVVRYSNDTKAPPDVVAVAVDGREVGRFAAADTGDEGHGWNTFRESSPVYADLEPGPHELALTPISGDSFGTEIDWVRIAPADAPTAAARRLGGAAALSIWRLTQNKQGHRACGMPYGTKRQVARREGDQALARRATCCAPKGNRG